MGALKTPDGYVDPQWQDLARRIHDGDGLNWRGDPTLSLNLGVITHRGRPVAHRLEVWKRTDQGENVMLSSWHPSEAYRICYDLCQMDPRSPGHVPVIERIEAENAAYEKAQDEKRAEIMIEAMDHAARVHVAKNEPGFKFLQMPGLKDTGPEATPSVDGVR